MLKELFKWACITHSTHLPALLPFERLIWLAEADIDYRLQNRNDQKCYRMVSIIYHLIDVIYWRSYAMSAHNFDWSFEKGRKKNVIFHHRLGESYRNLAKVRTTWISVTWYK